MPLHDTLIRQLLSQYGSAAKSRQRFVYINTTKEFLDLFLEYSGSAVILVFSAPWCGPCQKLKPVLADLAAEHSNVVVAYVADVSKAEPYLRSFMTWNGAVPTVGIFKKPLHPINWFEGVRSKHYLSELLLLEQKHDKKNVLVDLVVVGGGSAGCAAAKEARRLGKTVALVNKSDSRWGLGGTCINVGCVPKWIYHTVTRASRLDQIGARCNVDWSTMQERVRAYVKKIGAATRLALKAEGVIIIDEFASINTKSLNSVWCTTESKSIGDILASRCVLATGSKPRIPLFPGHEECITSDDFFFLESVPKRVLVVGGGYVAVECASVLACAGSEVYVAVRGDKILRGTQFDRQAVDLLAEELKRCGAKLLFNHSVSRVEKRGKSLHVQFQNAANGLDVDEVLLAVGREARVDALRYTSVQVERGAVQVKASARTPAAALACGPTDDPLVWAVGDVVQDSPSLATNAVRGGRHVVQMMYDTSLLPSWLTSAGPAPLNLSHGLPSCVFAPVEYARVGLSSEQARRVHGDAVRVYMKQFDDLLQGSVASRGEQPRSLAKIVCDAKGNVVGVHFVAAHASESIEGLAVALEAGVLTKERLDASLGVHPTAVEAFERLEPPDGPWKEKTGCGGGTCVG